MEPRVLIVDDAPHRHGGLRAMLEPAGLRVVGACARGDDAVARVAALVPDVIAIDLDLAGLDGLTTIERIMAERPTPIVVVAGDPRLRGGDVPFEALARGAVDVVPRPRDDAEVARLVDQVRAAASIPVASHGRGGRRRGRDSRPTTPLRPVVPAARPALPAVPPAVVVVGASTGGPGALRALIELLGADHPTPIVVIQHLPEELGAGFVRWLDSQVPAHVVEATPRTRIRPGAVHVAVRGPHVAIEADGTITAIPGRATPHCPSIDVLFSATAHRFGARAIGALLTGAGDDGAAGLGAIAAAGGVTLAQDEASSVVFDMPRAAIARGTAQQVLPIAGIARVVRDACRIVPPAARAHRAGEG
ncbi:MAG TPA: chemotaxis protein CheB [Kofleriaceae bacterium]|nr:chemotaxis protein CheB [Kofleriaceae bacterium]